MRVATSVNLATNSSPVQPADPIPTKAWVFYQKPHRNGCAGIVEHPVRNGQLGAAKPLNPAELQTYLNQVNAQGDLHSALLPANLLLNSPEQLVWYTPRQRRMMWFRCEGNHQLMVKWPPLLWRVTRTKRPELHLRALLTNSRPTLQTMTYRAPLMNISANGWVCQGTATIPPTVTASIESMQQVEATIFDSNFTHVNCADTFAGIGSDNDLHLAKWRALEQSQGRLTRKDLTRCETVSKWLSGALR